MTRRPKSKALAIPRKHQLTKEMGIILIIKLILIFLIWAICFSNPPAKHLNDIRFTEHLLNTPPQGSR